MVETEGRLTVQPPLVLNAVQPPLAIASLSPQC
jgi:hypothetical protein